MQEFRSLLVCTVQRKLDSVTQELFPLSSLWCPLDQISCCDKNMDPKDKFTGSSESFFLSFGADSMQICSVAGQSNTVKEIFLKNTYLLYLIIYCVEHADFCPHFEMSASLPVATLKNVYRQQRRVV